MNRLYRFFYGRYGTDELYKFLLILCLIILIINLFINNLVLRIIEYVIFAFTIYRCLSKDKRRRSIENRRYLELKNKIVKYYLFQKRKYKDRNTHMYKKCPKCHQRVRLPLKKGKHTVKCPSCSNKFDVTCRRDEKIKVEIVE